MTNSIDLSRRGLIKGAVMTAAATAAASGLVLPAATGRAAETVPVRPATALDALARDEAYWDRVRALYTVTPEISNLENGYFGIMPDPVRSEYHRIIDRVNTENSYYLRTKLGEESAAVTNGLAAAIGAKPTEIAITRGATEALQDLIVNYNKLQPGDAVIYSDLDYDSMQYAMEWLRARRGVEVVKFAMPEPATRQNVLDAYQRVLAATPKARMMLLTHISHRTGLAIPVAEIADMARARGVDVIVDVAHSWGQIDFKVADLHADFVGFNLHKWVGAPLGVGFLYIKDTRLADIDPHFGDHDFPESDVRSRVHSGTTNTANMLTVPKALEVHQAIGSDAKGVRLRHLRDYWVSQAREIKGVEILAPDEPGMYGALTSFRLAGRTDSKQNVALQNRLRDEFKVMTVRRGGVAKGDCIRVTTSLFTTYADLDRLIAALKVVAA